MAKPIIVGIDTGGTFTDFVAFIDGELCVHKRLSTPAAPAMAVLEGLKELLPEGRTALVTYSSTVATNALLERRGAKVVLLTTDGFADVLEIGRQNRPHLYALEPERPPPLVPRERRIGVAERMGADGKAILPLSRPALCEAISRVERLRPDAVAVCFLHSYANGKHEQQLGKALAELDDLFVSISHRLVPEFREYERTSTTVINAYVGPVMQGHLVALEKGLSGHSLRVMQSSGGAISAGEAAEEAVRTLLSGPAAGIIGAGDVANSLKLSRFITFDMGGTSTDVSLVDGAPRLQSTWEIGGLAVKVPAIDIHTVGAGGGSIAYVDPGGALKVGPQSAGADPGPACYGRGDAPTVTDANLVLGRLVGNGFLGGRMTLSLERATKAVSTLARRLGMTPPVVAEGIVRVANANMERAVRRISVERGHDPRDHALLVFGGAGGQHACELAMALGIKHVVLPCHPGVLSAWGAARADTRKDYVRSVRRISPGVDELRRKFDQLEKLARREWGAAPAQVHRWLDVRYVGQGHELTIPFSPRFADSFHQAHAEQFGYCDRARDFEVVHVRLALQSRGVRPPARVRPFPPRAAQTAQSVMWRGRRCRAVVHDRSALPPGATLRGPALICEFSATTFVPPGWSARVDRKTLHVELFHGD